MRVFAPAKVNLYLHILSRLSNGYHALDSLVMFGDVGDVVEITPSSSFEFTIDGPFARSLRGMDIDSGPQSTNLVVKAVWRLAQAFGKSPNVAVHLTKNLPLGAGIGGGSSDAAAVIWGLCDLWDIERDIKRDDAALAEILMGLGADVPVCFTAQSARILGVGDVFDAVPALDAGFAELHGVLVHPGKPCGTVDIFRGYNGGFREMVKMPDAFDTRDDLMLFLGRCDNDLTEAACSFVPEIENAIQGLSSQDGCEIARMSGSGSCCFGVFPREDIAARAAERLKESNPDWWVSPVTLGQIDRY